MEFIINLQLFANAGDVVNTTVGYNNAYTGANEAFSSENTLDPTLKTFYDTELLDNYRVNTYYAQFAKKQPLPAHHGKTVEWRKWNTFKRADALQEGVIPTGQKFGQSALTGTIGQFGTYTTVSDRLELRAYDDVIMGATEEMGASAAETEEDLIRKGLLTGTNVMYCDNIDLTTGAVKSTPTKANEMGASDTNGWAVLTPDMINKAKTIMKKNKVPMINGRYYAVIHPSVAYDLRKHPDWMEAHKYAAPEEIFNGEIGELHGVRFVENVFAPVLGGTDYRNKEGTVSYANMFFGKDAFGIIDAGEGGMEMIVKDKSEIGGPLNQFSTIGYKFEHNGATILYQERMLRVMSTSAFSATDTDNLD
jgi:N4-gp56 family major capsid protein